MTSYWCSVVTTLHVSCWVIVLHISEKSFYDSCCHLISVIRRWCSHGCSTVFSIRRPPVSQCCYIIYHGLHSSLCQIVKKNNVLLLFLADRTVTQYYWLLASYCHLSVCLSVCNAVHCGTQGQCRGWRLYCRVPRRALPIHFFRHFAVGIGCIVQPQHTAKTKHLTQSEW